MNGFARAPGWSTLATKRPRMFSIPRVKFGSADKDDGEKGIVQTLSFTALYNGSGTNSDVTTFAIQDSLA